MRKHMIEEGGTYIYWFDGDARLVTVVAFDEDSDVIEVTYNEKRSAKDSTEYVMAYELFPHTDDGIKELCMAISDDIDALSSRRKHLQTSGLDYFKPQINGQDTPPAAE